MTQEEERDLREQLARLHEEHRDLDAAIVALQDAPGLRLHRAAVLGRADAQALFHRRIKIADRGCCSWKSSPSSSTGMSLSCATMTLAVMEGFWEAASTR